MRFAIIDSKDCQVKLVEATELPYAAAGLKSGEVDFGTLYMDEKGAGLSIVVYEYGLFTPPKEGRYFSIGYRLFEGNAVVFAFDHEGETVSLKVPPSVTFYDSAYAVEKAIERGQISRPHTAVNGEVVWQWNRPSP